MHNSLHQQRYGRNHSALNTLSCSLLKTVKIKIYTTKILPVLLYGCKIPYPALR